jgi:hypothetical protein
VPNHLRYEVRLTIINNELRVDDEYLFLFPSGDQRRPKATMPLT